MKKLVPLLVLMLSCFAAIPQSVRVLSATDLQPVSQCLIYDQNKTISAVTNQQGEADVSAFKKDDLLIFSHISFTILEMKKTSLTGNLTTVLLSASVINLKEVVFSANKVEEKYVDLPAKIDILPARLIQFGNPQTTAELLQQNGTAYIQQSQLGGGSPVIRGMETNRVLIVIDGVRMNNAIYRAGHLQNVITIDPNILERVEVVHGPGSVIYGSDAMGGVMHFYSKNPILSTNGKVFSSGKAMFRYGSASQDYSQSFTMNIGGKKLAAIFGASTKNIGDLRQGSKRDSKYGDWGKCLYYAERINGVDSMMVNSDPLVQKNSAYSQYDIFSKVLWKPNEKVSFLLNGQYSNSSNIPRYDRLTEMSAGKLKYAEWYYGPQTRALISLKADFAKGSKLYDNASLLAAWQYISEDRVSRSFGKSKKKNQEETVRIFSVNADFMKKIFSRSELRYGLEGNVNYVDSKAYNKNIKTGEITNDAATRYPDGGGQMMSFAGYASNNWEINEKFIFSQGIRLNTVSLEAEYTQEMLNLIKFPFDAKMTQDNTAINGSLGLVFFPTEGWRLATNFSSGFRAPNIDDLTKLNDSNSTDQLIIVPNPDLKPEAAYNAELTIEKTFDENVQLSITGFYTLLADAFVISPFLYNGQDSIVFDGSLAAVQAMQNVEKATILGFEANAVARLTKHISVRSNLTFTKGTITEGDVPLDHIPPVYGMTSLKLEYPKFTGEIFARYNGWKHIENFSPSGEDNQTYATADGMPGWYTLNMRAGYQFNRYLNLQFAVENILDQHYRNFASGISAPGRNFMLTLRTGF
ncbi:MAG: TonB-dependent receptor [Bacteroidales bacterium]|nr:TonB-dependent receptor [Bacteroidales bacterium]